MEAVEVNRNEKRGDRKAKPGKGAVHINSSTLNKSFLEMIMLFLNCFDWIR
jgi:hypothetical protein